ncbi:acyl-CoA thioesterase [Corynebacterium caspium]|uniref:acyl-CoA thioesterase n=1 Tax=Corynebacterium caspium TaxID=234828 RepID=UPI0003772639|nr:thioesterase family protein [Corynebacterium caspium]WKD58824.1 acyl-CoA thioesterase YbgC [Corynebacterium caspium DSM 44850]
MTTQQSIPTPGIHKVMIPVRWSDFDRYGHMMNANYIEIAQEARLLFAATEFPRYNVAIPAFFVRNLNVDFMQPIMPDVANQVLVETQVVEIGRTSITTRQEIKNHLGEIACVVECVQVAVDMRSARPREITTEEKKVLAQAPEKNAGTEK